MISDTVHSVVDVNFFYMKYCVCLALVKEWSIVKLMMVLDILSL